MMCCWSCLGFSLFGFTTRKDLEGFVFLPKPGFGTRREKASEVDDQEGHTPAHTSTQLKTSTLKDVVNFLIFLSWFLDVS